MGDIWTMKKLTILFFFLTLSSFAQPSSNYFAIATQKDITNLLFYTSKQEFYAGSALRTATTNVADPYDSFLSGYYYPTNFTGYTTWGFPPRIIQSTNALLQFSILTTNTNTIVLGSYRVVLYTNDISAPMYDSGNLSWSNPLPPVGTNLELVHLTNNFPTNLLSYSTNYTTNVSVITTNVSYTIVTSNIESATVSIFMGPINTNSNWYPTWIVGGKIEFSP